PNLFRRRPKTAAKLDAEKSFLARARWSSAAASIPDSIAIETPVENTGSRNDPASPARIHRSPAYAEALYEKSFSTRTGHSRRASRINSSTIGVSEIVPLSVSSGEPFANLR